jgi:hypothetical protein
MLYKIYVRSILDFGSSIYNSNSKQNSIIIEQVQRRFTRYIFIRYFKYQYANLPSESLKILDLETLEIHRLKADLILFHKLVTQNVKLDSSILIFSNTHVTCTNPQGIVPVIAHKNASINFFFSRVSKLYLKLPIHATISIYRLY